MKQNPINYRYSKTQYLNILSNVLLVKSFFSLYVFVTNYFLLHGYICLVIDLYLSKAIGKFKKVSNMAFKSLLFILSISELIVSLL